MNHKAVGKNEAHERVEKEDNSAPIKRSSFIEILSLRVCVITSERASVRPISCELFACNMKTKLILQVNGRDVNK